MDENADVNALDVNAAPPAARGRDGERRPGHGGVARIRRLRPYERHGQVVNTTNSNFDSVVDQCKLNDCFIFKVFTSSLQLFVNISCLAKILELYK